MSPQSPQRLHSAGRPVAVELPRKITRLTCHRLSWAALLFAVAVPTVVVSHSEQLRADDESSRKAFDLLPDRIVAYAELDGLSQAVDLLLKHPLRSKLETLPQVEEFKSSKEFLQFRAGVSLFEAGMGKRWPAVLEALTSGGVAVAVDPETEGVVLLLQADSPETIAQLQKTVFPAIRGRLQSGERNDPIQSIHSDAGDYFSIRDKAFIASYSNWLLLTNKSELLVDMLQLAQGDASESPLSSSDRFTQARSLESQRCLLWGYLDTQWIRDSGKAPQLYSGKTDNPLTELLLGGLLATLKHTEVLTLAADLTQDEIELTVKSPFDTAWMGEERQFHIGENGSGVSKALPDSMAHVLAFSTYRDLSQLWLRAPDLMTEKAIDQMAQADSQLTTFFSGKDFGEEILGVLEPQIQFIAARQSFAEHEAVPAIKLPAFALRVQMKEPESTRREFRRVFHSLIGFINVVGAMEGSPPFDMEWEREAHREVISAKYATENLGNKLKSAPIQYNFEPAIFFADETLILASSKALGEKWLAQPESLAGDSNTALQVNSNILEEILHDNLEQLVAQNMLEKGHAMEEAEKEVGLLLELLRIVDQLSLKLHVGKSDLSLLTTVSLRNVIAPTQ